MAKLELKNLNKTFSQAVVPVKNFSLTVRDGEVLSLLGPSGCGKTTILRMIAGLEEPSRGEIWIGDRQVTRSRPGDRNVAMVFQSYALYPHMTVYDNLCAALKLKRVPKADIDQRVREVAGILGLEGLMLRKPKELSGGQRQRVAVGRALVRRPDVFLLDEPLSNLDALLRERVRADLKQIFSAQKVPIVYVTHDQTEAMTLSNQVAVLSDGYLQQLASPNQIYSKPVNIFVAGFVGSPQMNLLTLSCQGRHVWLGDFRIAIPDAIFTQFNQPPESIVLGIRPEHICLASADVQDGVEGQVTLVENLGMYKLVSVHVGTPPNSHKLLRVLLDPKGNWMPGQAITLSLPSDCCHWFEVNSGNRLFEELHKKGESD